MRLPIPLAALLIAGLSCASVQSNKTVCEEYRDLRCLTAVECSMNYQRGCQVCQCSPPVRIQPRREEPSSGSAVPK